MAPKRAPKKAVPPPQPHPPAESSDDADDSEDEEAIADSPVPAATPALKTKPAPLPKGDESESSDEEGEEPAPVAPKNQLQNKEDSDTSGSDDDEEEEEEDEPTRAAPPSALKKQPPQPQEKKDSDTSADQGESDGEAPPPKPAPKKAATLKPPAPAAAADKTKKPAGFQRIWSINDEVRILEALAAHKEKHGEFPQPDALIDILAGKLDNPAYGSKELQSKIKSLRHTCIALSKRGEVPSKEHDRRLLDLSKIVWDIHQTTPAASGAAKNAPNNGQERKGFEEMCELYPYLAEEVKGLEAVRPGMCKREFGKMDDDKARTMDEKIKKQRVAQTKVEMRRSDLVKEVTKALIDLVDG